MAMTSARKPPKQAIAFGCPTVTEALYIVRGPSGWDETFKRKELDAMLVKVLGTVKVDDVVGLFIGQRSISEDEEPTNWHTVIGFLGRLLGVNPLDVPSEAAIAFWGQIELAANSEGTN